MLFEGGPAIVPSLATLMAIVLTLGLWAVLRWLAAKSCKYKVTSKRIVIETGLLSKHTENVELYRVKDFVVDRPFGQWLFGTGNIIIETSDQTTPEVRIEYISADVAALAEQIRNAAEMERRQKGFRVVDVE